MAQVMDQQIGENYAIYNGDCVELVRGMPDESVGYSVFSPPFASLYTYSASPRDMGNCANHADFFAHFAYLADELMRVTKPGRLVSMHCMLLPTSKSRDGFIGLTDFRGDLIRAMQRAGFVFHSEVVIWKDPVTAMQRTKALGLLHKTIRKDSSMSRQGLPDYVVTMRKPTQNVEPIAHEEKGKGLLSDVEVWQRYASPVWVTTGGVDDEGFAICRGDTDPRDDASTIDPGDTLQYRSAREHDDERHICPLQLGVIRRCLMLWSNPGDTVLSPFAGIGSEGYVSLQEGRRFVGCELKRSYYDQAARNLASVDGGGDQMRLFG
jgi:DNA modification methylase